MKPGIGRDFIEGTKYQGAGRSDQEAGVAQPPLEWEAGAAEVLDLPAPNLATLQDPDLRHVIARRASLRAYAEVAFSIEELGFLLWATQGVRRVVPGRATFRTVPSAGARHALETFVSVQRVDGLEPGLYRYGAIEHRLISCSQAEYSADRLASACLGQTMVAHSAVTFIWVADRYRMAWRYGERGTRYLLLDAGHVCQNLYLAAEAMGAGACAIAAYDDDAVNGLLGLDGEDQLAVYLASVGKRQTD